MLVLSVRNVWRLKVFGLPHEFEVAGQVSCLQNTIFVDTSVIVCMETRTSHPIAFTWCT